MSQTHSGAVSGNLGLKLSRRAALGRFAAGGASAALVAGRHGALAPVTGAEASTAPVEPPTQRFPFTVGRFDVLVLSDGVEAFEDYATAAVNAPPRELARTLQGAGITSRGYRFPLNPLLIDTGANRVLIDTGSGSIVRPGAPHLSGHLLPALRAEGMAPEEIDVVVITHGHFDHIGGAVDDAGRPAFPNARYVMSRADWDFWTSEPSLAELPFPAEAKAFFRDAVRRFLVPLAGRIELLEADAEVVPGVRAFAAPGHTPGHLALEVASDGERLLHVADAAADPVLSLRHPDWFLAPDTWPAQALLTRRRLLDRAAAEGLLVMAYHFPFPALGRVATDGDGWRWEPVG